MSGMNDSEDESGEWDFADDQIIRADDSHEYKIRRLLRQESDGKRFYHVEKEQGGTHLFSAGAIEGRYDVIDASESRAFEEEST